MNKNDLIEYMAEEAELTKADAGRALDAFINGITEGLKSNGEVRLVGFGNFYTSERKAGTGRNPQTGEAIKIKASTQAKFKAGKQLKDSVNDNKSKAKSKTAAKK